MVLFWIESSSFRARHYTAQIPTGSSKIYALPGSYRLLSTAVQAVEYCSRLLNTAVQAVEYSCTGCCILLYRLLSTAVLTVEYCLHDRFIYEIIAISKGVQRGVFWRQNLELHLTLPSQV